MMILKISEVKLGLKAVIFVARVVVCAQVVTNFLVDNRFNRFVNYTTEDDGSDIFTGTRAHSPSCKMVYT